MEVCGPGGRGRFGLVCAVLLNCHPASAAEAFITDQTGNEVSVLDLAAKQVVARIPVPGKPAGIAMTRDGKTACVTSTEGKFVAVIDTASRKVAAKVAMPDTPLGIAADPRGGFVYAAGFYQPKLYKIDLAQRRHCWERRSGCFAFGRCSDAGRRSDRDCRPRRQSGLAYRRK